MNLISSFDMSKLVLLACLLPLWAQEPSAEKPKASGRMPEPKNLQVLKVPASELIPIMMTFNAGLGVQCVFCHVVDDFASDDKQHKAIARKMIEMTKEINAKFPDGKMHVGCYTCHRGETEPKLAPPAEKRLKSPA